MVNISHSFDNSIIRSYDTRGVFNKTLFEKEGFEVESAEILFVTSRKNPDQVMDSFESGATLAYCNPDSYRESITQEKFDDFRNIVRKNF